MIDETSENKKAVEAAKLAYEARENMLTIAGAYFYSITVIPACFTTRYVLYVKVFYSWRQAFDLEDCEVLTVILDLSNTAIFDPQDADLHALIYQELGELLEEWSAQ